MEQTSLDDETIIAAVKRLNAGYDNSNYRVRQATKVAGGSLYPVTFQGRNNEWYENYVFQRGNATTAYSSATDLLKDYRNTISPLSDPEFLKLLFVGVIATILCAAIIFGSLSGVDGKAISVLAGLFGTAFGYVVGHPVRTRRSMS